MFPASLGGVPPNGAACLFEAGEKHAYEKIVFARFAFDALK